MFLPKLDFLIPVNIARSECLEAILRRGNLSCRKSSLKYIRKDIEVGDLTISEVDAQEGHEEAPRSRLGGTGV